MKHETMGGEQVAITNLQIRYKDDIIDIEAWRDQAEPASKIKPGAILFFAVEEDYEERRWPEHRTSLYSAV